MADQPILQIAEAYRKALLKRERKAAARLVQQYGLVWARLSKRLEKLTKQIEDARARGEIVNYAWLLRQERYAELLAQVDAQFKRFADTATKTITAQQSAAVNAASSGAVEIAQAAGIGGTFNRLPSAAFENMVGFLGNGSPLRSLIDQLPRAARRIVEQGLTEAVALGVGSRETARKIRAGLGGNLNRALLISRTETARAYRAASQQTYQANRDVVRGWYWRSARNSRCCAACIAMDGTFHSVDEPMKSHPGCRCVQIPGVQGVEVDKGADWFAKQPAKVQRDILNTDSGYDAYRKGELALTDFVGLKRNILWGDHYHQLGVARARAGEGRWPDDWEPTISVADALLRFRA